MGGGGVSQRNRTMCLAVERLSDTQHPQFLPTLAIAIIEHAPLRRLSPLLPRTKRTSPSERRDPSGAGPEEKRSRGCRCAAARQCALPPAARGPRRRLRGDGRRGRRCAVFPIISWFHRSLLLIIGPHGANSAPITVLGEVLAQWPQMFRILNLFRMSSLVVCWCEFLMT